MFHINAENTSTFLLLRCSLTLKSHYALCFRFQSFWPSCVRRRASSVSLTTTSWERRSTRRRDFVFPECSCRASSQSWANHRAHDVIWPISCHHTNFKRSWETEDWNVCLILNRKRVIYSLGPLMIYWRGLVDFTLLVLNPSDHERDVPPPPTIQTVHDVELCKLTSQKSHEEHDCSAKALAGWIMTHSEQYEAAHIS